MTNVYRFRGGKFEGRAVASVMLEQPVTIFDMYYNYQSGKWTICGPYWQIKNIVERADSLEHKIVMECPQCKILRADKKPNKVKHLSIYRGYNGVSVGADFTCCDLIACKKNVLANSSGKARLYPFKFSIFKNFKIKFDQKMIMEIFKRAFGLGKRISAQKATDFFLD